MRGLATGLIDCARRSVGPESCAKCSGSLARSSIVDTEREHGAAAGVPAAAGAGAAVAVACSRAAPFLCEL
eukprot:1841131-Pleurochrysis_carterae.AAC.1